MSKFVSFWAQFRNGQTFIGNMVIDDFELQSDEDIRNVETRINTACNSQSYCCTPDTEVQLVSLINWKAL